MLKKIRYQLAMGFIVLLPAILTIYVLQFIFKVVDPILGGFLSSILVTLHLIPRFPIYLPWGMIFENRIPGLGIVVTIFLLIGVGFAGRSFFGKQFIKITERLFYRIPIARSIYSTVQQITNAFTQDKSSFKRVVLVEYPRKGLYTMGFLTGECQGELKNHNNKQLMNVFMPTTPNPTSGWLALVPYEDVVFLDMSVEEGLKYIISGGVVQPPEKFIGEEKKGTMKVKEKHEQEKEKELVTN